MSAILALALGVRLYRLEAEDFWQDEIDCLYTSAGTRGEFRRLPTGVILSDLPRFWELTNASTLAAVWRTLRDETHPPLYFLLLLGWRRLVGDGEAAIRVMPAIFSWLSIFPAALSVREYARADLRRNSKEQQVPLPTESTPQEAWLSHSDRAGLITAVLLAVSYAHLQIGQNNRPYSLAGLWVSLSFYLFARLERRWGEMTPSERRLHLSAYGLSLFLAMMTHYFAGLVFLGQLLYALLRSRGHLLRAWLFSVIAAAILFGVTWLPTLWHQRELIAAQDWLLETQPNVLERTLMRATSLPIRLLYRTEPFELRTGGAIVGGTLLLGIVAYHWRKRANGMWSGGCTNGALAMACWYLVPVALLTAVDLTAHRQHLAHLRYLSAAIPGLIGLIALALVQFRKPLATVALAALLLPSIPTLQSLPAQENPRSRMAAAVIAADLRPGDLVVYDGVDWPAFQAPRLYQMVSYYLPGKQPPTLLLTEIPDEALRNQMSRYGRIYVVTGSPPSQRRPDYLPTTHTYVELADYIHLLGWVYRFSQEPGGIP